jgi:TonB family protein
MPNTPTSVAETAAEQARAFPSVRYADPDAELQLLLSGPDEQETRRWHIAAALSLAAHILIFFAGIQLESLIPREHKVRSVPRKAYTKLYIPRDLLTQRDANRSKVSKVFDLADQVAPQQAQRRLVAPAPGNVRRLEVPKEALPAKQPAAAPPAPDLPNPVQANVTPPNGAPDAVIEAVPAPSAVPPSNPVQNAGVQAPQPKLSPRLAPPKNSVQDVIQQMAKRDAQSPSMTISSDDAPNLPVAPGQQGQQGRLGSTIELQTDPQGVDFKPYLSRILAIVRRNWFSVLPDSARMGALRGRTTIQFEVSRDGSIPKLVIADSSGVQPLDRAAIAGLSMSNPLPPLPPEFKGLSIRLQFSFNYHVPSL